MQFEVNTHVIAEHFLSALINGDYSGLDEGDEALLSSWEDWACDEWEDADGRTWIFAHYGDTRENGFDEDEVTNLYAQTCEIDLVFTPK